MNNMTKQVIRHFNHKHSRLLQELIIEDKLKLSPTGPDNRNTTDDISQSIETTSNNCFSTNQVLFIIAVTCFLNFAFILLIMMCVQILGSTSSEPENSDEDLLIADGVDDMHAENGHLTNLEASKVRLASFPDNVITRKVADRLLKSKKLNSKCKCMWMHRNHSQQPISRTYHFTARHLYHSDESETEPEFTRYDDDFPYKWNQIDEYRPNCTIPDFKSN